jgi:hypothetical protein
MSSFVHTLVSGYKPRHACPTISGPFSDQHYPVYDSSRSHNIKHARLNRVSDGRALRLPLLHISSYTFSEQFKMTEKISPKLTVQQ